MTEIKDKLEFRGLIIGRLPSWAKTYIKTRAKDEFCDDYGALLSYLIRQVEEYEMFKSKFLNSELAIQLISQSQSTENETRIPKSISGDPIKLRRKK